MEHEQTKDGKNIVYIRKDDSDGSGAKTWDVAFLEVHNPI